MATVTVTWANQPISPVGVHVLLADAVAPYIDGNGVSGKGEAKFIGTTSTTRNQLLASGWVHLDGTSYSSKQALCNLTGWTYDSWTQTSP